MKLWVLGLALLCAATARAGYLAPGAASAAGAKNIVLIYDGGQYHRNWMTNDFVPLMSYVNRQGRITGRMYDTLLVLPLWARSGRGYTAGFGTGPSNKEDWLDYLDNTLFGNVLHLNKMEAAAGVAGYWLSATPLTWKVILTIPYPDPAQHAWGSLTDGGPVLDFANLNDRISAVRWYVDELTRRWQARGYQHIQWVGLYWLEEYIHAVDPSLIPWVAAMAHQAGCKLFWIPYYNATGWSQWKTYGFDAAIYQPNYFFSTATPFSRLHSAASGAKTNGLGVELELDDRAITDPAFRSRYYDYLNAGAVEGFQTGAVTAWYMGGDTLLKCQASADATVRAIYDDTYKFIFANGVHGDATADRIVDFADVRAILKAAAGLQVADTQRFSASTDLAPNNRADVADAVKLMRYLSGLQPTLP
ncbi:MAG TPA: DUF4855 domain-containing protein [Armatimonadota bacterium]